ncbi:MAG TPA: hypothetical protein VH369_17580 [Bryobacteraceae bacterium]
MRRIASQFGVRQQPPRHTQDDSLVARHDLLERRQISSLGVMDQAAN